MLSSVPALLVKRMEWLAPPLSERAMTVFVVPKSRPRARFCVIAIFLVSIEEPARPWMARRENKGCSWHPDVRGGRLIAQGGRNGKRRGSFRSNARARAPVAKLRQSWQCMVNGITIPLRKSSVVLGDGFKEFC